MSVFDIIRFIFTFYCVTMSERNKETVLINNEAYILGRRKSFRRRICF